MSLVMMALFGCKKGGTQEDEFIYIGALASITGYPLNGQHMVEGIQLAIDEVNARGGVLGKQVKLIVEDSSNNPDTGINAANRLTSTNVVGIIGPHYSSVCMAVESIVGRAKIPMLFGGTSPKLVREVNNPYIFRIRASDEIQALAACKYLVSNIGAKKVGIMYGSDEFGTGAYQVAKEYFDSIGLPYVAEAHNVDDKDVTGQIAKLKAAQVDSVLIWSVENPYIVCARQLYEQGLRVPTIGNPSLFVQAAIDQFQPAWVEGYYGVTDFMTANPNSLVQDFINRYTSKYNGEIPDLHSAAYYGGAILLLDAVQRAGSTDGEAIRSALMGTSSLQGIVGNFTPNEYGEMIHEITVGQMKDLQPEFISVTNG
jgi:branched-chain amino acid transport system substrate-binding protein